MKIYFSGVYNEINIEVGKVYSLNTSARNFVYQEIYSVYCIKRGLELTCRKIYHHTSSIVQNEDKDLDTCLFTTLWHKFKYYSELRYDSKFVAFNQWKIASSTFLNIFGIFSKIPGYFDQSPL